MGYTNKMFYNLATKSPRELKLISNNCYDNVLQICDKINE